MPLMTDITTIRVVVAITTPRSVRKERSLCVFKASRAIQKASRAVTQALYNSPYLRRECFAGACPVIGVSTESPLGRVVPGGRFSGLPKSLFHPCRFCHRECG